MGEGVKTAPRTLAILCEHSGAPALSAAGIEHLPLPDTMVASTLHCAANLDHLMVLKALWEGVGGILVIGCPEASGHFRGCAEIASRRVALLKNVLAAAGLDPKRIAYIGVRPSDNKVLAREAQAFAERVASLGEFHGIG
jgi:coenzyme F420-reducing hydrogenase delta subunit